MCSAHIGRCVCDTTKQVSSACILHMAHTCAETGESATAIFPIQNQNASSSSFVCVRVLLLLFIFHMIIASMAVSQRNSTNYYFVIFTLRLQTINKQNIRQYPRPIFRRRFPVLNDTNTTILTFLVIQFIQHKSNLSHFVPYFIIACSNLAELSTRNCK